MTIQTIKNIGHLIEAVIANIWYGFPSRKLVMIGVTGTDGKTTTSSMIYQILQSAGYKTALISTVGAYIGDNVFDVGFHVTTPSPFALQKYLRKAVEEGMTHCVLEVTSHALDQNRAFCIHFHVGVLTNITHEHLDYHKTYENYVKAKVKLLKNSDVSFINKDDQSYDLVKSLLGRRVVYTYGKPLQFKTNLEGLYNQYNATAAGLAAQEVGVSQQDIRKALLRIAPPKGRCELVYKKDFTVVIDFAHTPNAFHMLLPELKKKTKGRLIHVFGSAGKRDHTKRPLMGKESSAFADVILLTAEDPRGEPIEAICQDIAAGSTKPVQIIPDRKEAIETAIRMAKKGDTVVITGKSHEKSMNYDGNTEEPWDEFEVVKQGLKKRLAKQ
ncbi:MAG: UDP-N-acetylmuramoyl-L-alanyl-D-glutamate--2,6-diaminopimelate ligase [Patescibacteria group bacterium]|nr:UDP-N-acetylmuramoyl-L-alanyl-D-glutamate--2,6-diaminopimelate ligase [Patescibacteria group bacterium]